MRGALRTKSPTIQVFFLAFMVYFLAGIGELIYFLTLQLVVGEQALINADLRDARIVLSHTLFFQVIGFLIAFIAMLRLTGQRLYQIVSMEKLQWKYFGYTFIVFLLGMFVLPGLSDLNAPLAEFLPADVLESEALRNAQNENIMVQSDPIQFGFALIVMGLLPAICEELIFRGFLIRKMLESGMGFHGVAIFSSLLFAITHMQPLKILPMFVLGLLLAYVYLYFRNIKYSMFLHFLINGSQILMAYLIGTGVLPSA